MIIQIPGRVDIEIKYAVFDFNGTLATDGVIPGNVRQMLEELSKQLQLYVITSDTYGTAEKECAGLPVVLRKLEGPASAQKAEIVNGIGNEYCVCFGNGFNDINMFKCSRLSIAIVSYEGLCAQLLQHADLLVTSICDGINLLLKPNRITAGLRR